MTQGMGGLVREAVPPQQHPHFLRHFVGVVWRTRLGQEQLVHDRSVANLWANLAKIMTDYPQAPWVQWNSPLGVPFRFGDRYEPTLDIYAIGLCSTETDRGDFRCSTARGPEEGDQGEVDLVDEATRPGLGSKLTEQVVHLALSEVALH